ncbi:MAG: 3-dehydroquinate synthase [Nitrospirae bacterium]|nr:3-dehydroquinate synthase [Nitrospirota bacterium]
MNIFRQKIAVTHEFRVIFTRSVFSTENTAFADILRDAGNRRHRVLAAVDSNVLDAMPELCERLRDYAEHHADLVQLVAPPTVVRGGEACKHGPDVVAEIHALIERHHICRQSFVIAIGGGAVLDAVGYAAATAHRGVRLIRMPTTVLAQNDAGVGVKNGINAFGKKNYLGSFAPPYAVINDFDFLKSLPARELRAGISEAVKVAVIKDAEFFDYLYSERLRLAAFAPDAMEQMIQRCAELHLQHIAEGGDPFEMGSARPLDFGHWTAHRLEELTGGELRHGEAVAIGVALDSVYAQRLGLISEFELARIIGALDGIGFSLYHWALRWMNIHDALEAFREHLGGELHITLPNGMGRKVEVNNIDEALVAECITVLSQRKTVKSGVNSSVTDTASGATRHDDRNMRT